MEERASSEYIFESSSGYAEEDDQGYVADTVADTEPLCNQKEKTMLPAAVLSNVLQETASIARTLQLPLEYTIVLLKHFNWDVDKLNDAYFEKHDALFKELRLTSPSSDNTEKGVPTITAKRNTKDVDCCICRDTIEVQKGWSVECNHWLCQDCLSDHLPVALAKKGELFPMRCPTSKCTRLWPFAVIETILKKNPNSDLLTKYHRFAVDTMIDSKGMYQWCTSPTGGCGSVVRVHHRQADAYHVQCGECMSKFCFNCSDEAHGPTTCKMLREWKVKQKDDSETAHWVQANTKCCPKCNKMIEKNGGCNHMTCSQCRNEFCWVCSGPWSAHGSSYYNCNQFKDGASDAAESRQRSAKESLQRYMFYLERFENHEKSKKLDTKVMDMVTQRAKELLQSGACDIGGIAYLEDTAKTLFDCRHTLKFTYVYGYYMDTPQRKLFEYNQSQLEAATEELSFIIEGKAALDRQQVLNRVAVAKKMLSTLIEGKYGE